MLDFDSTLLTLRTSVSDIGHIRSFMGRERKRRYCAAMCLCLHDSEKGICECRKVIAFSMLFTSASCSWSMHSPLSDQRQMSPNLEFLHNTEWVRYDESNGDGTLVTAINAHFQLFQKGRPCTRSYVGPKHFQLVHAKWTRWRPNCCAECTCKEDRDDLAKRKTRTKTCIAKGHRETSLKERIRFLTLVSRPSGV